MARGALLYDLFFALRYDRKTAKGRNVWSIMCRMAQDWKDEDQAAGREPCDNLDRAVARVASHNIMRTAL